MIYKRKLISILLWVALLCAVHPLAAFSQPCDGVPDHFAFTSNTGESYSIVLDSVGFACSLQECDEIGVFDGDLCVGASVYQGTWPLAIVAWADDSQTGEADGYACGNTMSFRIWHVQSQSETANAVGNYSAGDGTFCSGPYARLWLACEGCDDIPDHFSFASNTGDSYSIVLDSTGIDCGLQSCDEIGVFDGDLCVGASVFRGTWPLAIIAWADDPQSGEVDGYICGHEMSFRMWNSQLDFEISSELYGYYSAGDGTFCSGPYSRLWLHCHWLCGDCDHSGFVDIDDVFVIVNYVFLGGTAPLPLEMANVNCAEGVDIDDIYRLVAYIFLGEYAPCDPDDDGTQDCYLFTP